MPRIFRLPGFIVCLIIAFAPLAGYAQSVLHKMELDSLGRITALFSETGKLPLTGPLPLLSYELNGITRRIDQPSTQLAIQASPVDSPAAYLRIRVRFRNLSADTLLLTNVLPLQIGGSEAYITGLGNHPLSRTHLFLPGKIPVNVIVPDNAWDLGYNGYDLGGGMKLCALSRRDRSSIRQGERSRFETRLYPGGTVEYSLYFETYTGPWQQGLTRVFQQRWLYDLTSFDDSLFRRKDLQWIRSSYIMHLMDAWDKFYYDDQDNRYHLQEFLSRGKKLYGGDEVVGIWPTWPTLGLDQRNQFDLFKDLPGGTAAMRRQAELSRKAGTRFFICYNPWDEGTRAVNHFEGLAELIAQSTADGVVLDTKGESSRQLQESADKVRPGVIMYSEGMAVPRDMPGIVSGRVHNALYYPPMLNLNKLIKPEFSIFRVAELYKEKIRREFATSFFNGYGTEINIMAPGQPDWVEEQYRYLGRTTRILRENSPNFTEGTYTPLIPVSSDSIWVNQWERRDKTIYTIYSTLPGGYRGKLFTVQPVAGWHYVDLWQHRLLDPVSVAGQWWINAETDGFNSGDLGTNNEGGVDCIARLPRLLEAGRYGNILLLRTYSTAKNLTLKVWAGMPAYDKTPLTLPGSEASHRINITNVFGRYEGDLVIQLLQEGILLDETLVSLPPGTARRVSVVEKTPPAGRPPAGMVPIPAGRFRYHGTNGDEFIPYPAQDQDSIFSMSAFYMDQYPVTNLQFRQFLQASGYRPTDTANFLKHWQKGRIPAGQENFPVVYVSFEDARAYAVWAGKRLPTELEWQYSAEGGDGRGWPWKQQNPVTRKEEVITATLTVTSLEGIDSANCNLGNGRLYPVGAYPKGVNPYGLFDLVGCVWQLTADQYLSGSHRYLMLKGGSYFKPSASWWYVQGGPRELQYRQFLLRVSQGFERNATVGFRCVKDR